MPVAEFIADVHLVSSGTGSWEDTWEVDLDQGLATRRHVLPRREKFTPAKSQCPVPLEQLSEVRVTQEATLIKGQAISGCMESATHGGSCSQDVPGPP